jgi:hypothetical protein
MKIHIMNGVTYPSLKRALSLKTIGSVGTVKALIKSSATTTIAIVANTIVHRV